MPSPLRCGAVPTAPPPGQANSDNNDDGARVAACGNAGYGDSLGSNNAAAAAVADEADNTGQENDDCSGNNGDNDEDADKWGRGA